MALTVMVGERNKAQNRFFIIVFALLFIGCLTATIIGCAQMSAMEGMTMAGGWNMSMMWMLMPGQTMLDGAIAFLGMWVVMMAVMMLPVLLPMLWCYRQGVGKVSSTRIDLLTVMVSIGYFVVWLLAGLAIFPLGIWLATLAMHYETLANAVPMVTAIIVMLAGFLQFTSWKAHQLSCCRSTYDDDFNSANIFTALYYGLRIGLRCNYCCAGLTAVLLVIGVMNLLAMALIAIAIMAERILPSAETTARLIGVVLVGVGFCFLIQATGMFN